MPSDHYRTLGVAPDATPAELRAAYLKLARAHHPDATGTDKKRAAEAEMQRINEAWNVLGTPHRRAEYDRSRPDAPETARPSSPRRGRSHFAPFDPFDDDTGERADVDLDPTPIPGSRGLPQWASFVPMLFIASGLGSFGFGMLVRAGSIVAFAAVLIALGLISFLMLPLWVMSRAEKDPGM